MTKEPSLHLAHLQVFEKVFNEDGVVVIEEVDHFRVQHAFRVAHSYGHVVQLYHRQGMGEVNHNTNHKSFTVMSMEYILN